SRLNAGNVSIKSTQAPSGCCNRLGPKPTLPTRDWGAKGPTRFRCEPSSLALRLNPPGQRCRAIPRRTARTIVTLIQLRPTFDSYKPPNAPRRSICARVDMRPIISNRKAAEPGSAAHPCANSRSTPEWRSRGATCRHIYLHSAIVLNAVHVGRAKPPIPALPPLTGEAEAVLPREDHCPDELLILLADFDQPRAHRLPKPTPP